MRPVKNTPHAQFGDFVCDRVPGYGTAMQNVGTTLGLRLKEAFSEKGEPQFAAEKTVVIVGGGSSLSDAALFVEMKEMAGTKIVAGAAHDALIQRGLRPDIAVIYDAAREQADYLQKADPEVTYLVASHCDPAVFSQLERAGCEKVLVWHADIGDNTTVPPRLFLVGGDQNTGVRATLLAMQAGATSFHYFGVDGSLDPKTGNLYHYPKITSQGTDDIRRINVKDQHFYVPDTFMRQFTSFRTLQQTYGKGRSFVCHGSAERPTFMSVSFAAAASESPRRGRSPRFEP